MTSLKQWVLGLAFIAALVGGGINLARRHDTQQVAACLNNPRENCTLIIAS